MALVRLEQLYPLEEKSVARIKKTFPKASFVWIQEGPSNGEVWSYLMRWPELFRDFHCISRPASAAPATGHGGVHRREQEELIRRAFEEKEG